MSIKVSAFIQQVKIPLKEQWGYIYGTWGRVWTAQLQQAWSQPSRTNWQKTKQYGSKWIGRMVTDCSGLVRRACYNLGQQVAHHSHYLYTDYCRNKGKLVNGRRSDGTLPRAGSLVFLNNKQGRKHHVGVYIGDDTVIQAKGTQYGVVTSNLAHWDAWGQLRCINYDDRAEEPTQPVIIDDNKKYARVQNPGIWLNMRRGPKKSQSVIMKIPKGALVEILQKTTHDWWKIKYDGKIGYSASEYLREQ